MNKICNHCKVSKSIEQFGKNKRFIDGVNVTCKICTKIHSARFRSKPKIFSENKRCSKCYLVKLNSEFTLNPGTKDGFHSKCKVCRGLTDKIYRDKIKDKVKTNNRNFREKNLEHLKNYGKLYKKRRQEKDPLFKLAINISSLIRGSFKNKSIKKNSKTHDILGIDYEGFSYYLNNNIFGFKITDYDMDLDHIIPISFATNEKELIMLNHYTNFQLLPKIYNRGVKRNKVLGHEHLENWLKETKYINF